MLNRLSSGENGTTHSFGGACVRDDRSSRGTGHFHYQLQLIQRESGTSLAVRSPAVVGVNLNYIGAAADLLSNGPCESVDAIRFLSTLRNVEIRCEPLGRIAPGGNESTGGDQHSWPGDNPLRNCLLDAHIRVSGPFGAEVAYRREAGV